MSDAANYLNGLFSLEGKTALIPGGNGVLGGAIAHGLGQAGARIALMGRSAEKLEAVSESLKSKGVEVAAHAADCTNPDAFQEALDQAEQVLGPVDILVNAVGGNVPEATVPPGCSVFDVTLEGMHRVVDVNLMAGAVIPTLAVGKRLRELKRPGSIINITSVSADRPLSRIVGYGASKAAVKSFTEYLAVELAKEGDPLIRVNALVPGFFLTEQNRFLLTTDGETLTERGQTIISQTPMGRFGDPDELIGGAVYLASDASKFVTGISLEVDGGFCTHSGV
jgi:NAD(P)-dependent dehydrogenase (short-subunit alcohol dehydrogenase family)